jgi:hypothetical protein
MKEVTVITVDIAAFRCLENYAQGSRHISSPPERAAEPPRYATATKWSLHTSATVCCRQ